MVFHGMGHGQVGQVCFAAGLDDRGVVAPVDEIPQGRGADEDEQGVGQGRADDGGRHDPEEVLAPAA